MFKIPIHIPASAIRRIQGQINRPNFLHSLHQQIRLPLFTDAELQTYLAIPHAFASLKVQDFDQILPYTTLDFQIGHTVAPAPDEPWLCGLFTTTGQNAAQVGAQLCAQINLYASTMGAQFPDMRSMHARLDATSTNLMLDMPWGMLAAPSFVWGGPGAGASPALAGVDHPLFIALWDKKRAIFLVKYPYRDDYYGDVPET